MLFPLIKHIDDVLPHIEGCDDFIVAERDGYTIINYMLESGDTFPPLGTDTAAIRRECRGIIFDSSGKIIRRPLFKFFNINQNEETALHNLDFSDRHSIFHKLDGSMIAPFLVEGNLIWGTKMAAPDFHEAVKSFVKDSIIDYEGFATKAISLGYTPIFEWMHPDTRIVINYGSPALTLLAVRHMSSGVFVDL